MRALVTVLGLLVTVVACGREPEADIYQLKGQVLFVRAASREILVKHEDIPGFMPAMSMTYTVKDPAVLDGVAAGDVITATLHVSDTLGWLSDIVKTGTAPIEPGSPTKIPAAAGVHVLQPGDEAPVTTLTGQDDQPLSLASWRGTAVAVTFIYTRCPLPQYCPLLDRRFAEVQALAEADPALKGRVRLLSVSFDPAVDTTALLRAHAGRLKADPSVWSFAVAPEETVDRFAAQFGVNVIREADQTITHNLRTAVIDPAGKVTVIRDSNEWTAEQLAGDLRRALGRQQ